MARQRLAEIDELTTRIIDGSADPDGQAPGQVTALQSRLRKLAEYLRDALPAQGGAGSDPDRARDGMFGGRTAAAPAPGDWMRGARPTQGIEVMQSRPTQLSEDDMMAAIKAHLIEQKREINRRNLPELTPPAPEADAGPAAPEPAAAAPATPVQRLKAAALRIFRQDPVLSMSVIFWVLLALTLIIGPMFAAVLMCALIVRVLISPGSVVDMLSEALRRIVRQG